MILFCGTAGCGKSTLASLTASRLGITTVLSTDFVRHMLRRELSQENAPILYASTYNAGEALPAEERPTDLKECILKGYHEQSAMILDRLERVIASYEARREALIVEGVHLTLDAMARFRVQGLRFNVSGLVP
jgi:2-phosphoglycerate kinase